MAMDYQNITAQERLKRIAQIINKGIYLYYQKSNDKVDEPLQQEKAITPIMKINCKENDRQQYQVYPDNEVLTTKEAMDFLKISRTTLWRLRKQRKVNFYLISKSAIRYALLDIVKYLEDNKQYKRI